MLGRAGGQTQAIDRLQCGVRQPVVEHGSGFCDRLIGDAYRLLAESVGNPV